MDDRPILVTGDAGFIGSNFVLQWIATESDGVARLSLLHAPDRPGHHRRYAIESATLRGELGWQPRENFETGIRRTVQWYLDNMA